MSKWSQFRREVFGEPYMVWHDGADFTNVARRYAEDPDSVLALLKLGIGKNDEVAAQACRHLDPSPEQVPLIVDMLEAALPRSSGSARIDIAASLHAIGASRHSPEELAQEICSVLQSRRSWGVRLDAAIRLAEFAPTTRLVEAASAGVRDKEYLVRFHSANTLMRWAGWDHEVWKDEELFSLIRSDAAPAQWARAADRLAAAVKL